MNEETEYSIHDTGTGIVLQVSFPSGLLIGFEMTDQAAQQMINIIQNKLNARIP